MSSERGFSKQPFRTLGGRLKSVREQAKETLAEVSGAVEIDVAAMQQIESGESQPSEEILLLLISHFDITDEEATKLWELAGYNQDNDSANASEAELIKKVAALLPLDGRITYTDMIHVAANDYGVVMNFMQNAGPNGQPLLVSRLGMSKEHAQSVISVLQKTLDQAEQKSIPKSLPAPKTNRKTDRNR
jgi:transcriptional regulator with XRE-family HTH domain